MFAFARGEAGVRDAAAEAAAEGATVTALVLRVRVWVDGKVVG